MKRIAAFILLILYFVTSTGATMHYHFCMGEMANSSLWRDKEEKCSKCGMDKDVAENNGCCKDEQQWVKIKDDQKSTVCQLEISKLQLTTICFIFFDSYLFVPQNDHQLAESRAPLRSSEQATYLLNCVFRI